MHHSRDDLWKLVENNGSSFARMFSCLIRDMFLVLGFVFMCINIGIGTDKLMWSIIYGSKNNSITNHDFILNVIKLKKRQMQHINQENKG